MNTLHAAMVICSSTALVLFATGIQTLQSRLEKWDYERHFGD